MKILGFLIVLLVSASAYACPDLEGRYPKCKSEIKDIRGEYTVEQFLKDDVTYYQLHYIDDETDESRTDSFRADGTLESRKEKIPKLGITVRIDSRSKCEGDAVVSNADVFFLGKKVGFANTKIYKVGTTLHSTIDGKYLNKEVAKRITCTQE